MKKGRCRMGIPTTLGTKLLNSLENIGNQVIDAESNILANRIMDFTKLKNIAEDIAAMTNDPMERNSIEMEIVNLQLEIEKMKKEFKECEGVLREGSVTNRRVESPFGIDLVSGIDKMSLIIGDLLLDLSGIQADIKSLRNAEDENIYYKFIKCSIDMRREFLNVLEGEMRKDSSYRMGKERIHEIWEKVQKDNKIEVDDKVIETIRTLYLTFNIALQYTVNDFNNSLAAFDEIAYKYINY